MLKALILALLASLLPAPVAAQGAACHGSPTDVERSIASEEHADDHGARQDKHHLPADNDTSGDIHSCIGCVPPGSGLPQAQAPTDLKAIDPVPGKLEPLLSSLPQPDTPPPRLKV